MNTNEELRLKEEMEKLRTALIKIASIEAKPSVQSEADAFLAAKRIAGNELNLHNLRFY